MSDTDEQREWLNFRKSRPFPKAYRPFAAIVVPYKWIDKNKNKDNANVTNEQIRNESFNYENQLLEHPHNMPALSKHDTKRSNDK